MFIIEKDFAGRQIPGARPYQEDAQGFGVLGDEDEGEQIDQLLTVLADGMGGENAGGVASRTVVREFVDFCYQHYSTDPASPSNIPELLNAAAQSANQHLVAAIEENPELFGMGTTLLATVTTQTHLYWISIGDSPLFLYRDGQLTKLSADHSMMPLLLEELENGNLNESDLTNHPDRNVLRSALTGDPIELIDCPPEGVPLTSQDLIIVASDGLDTLPDEAIRDRMERHRTLPAEGIVDKLLTAVQNAKKPKQDNTSINVICIPAPNRVESDIAHDEGKTRLIRREKKA